MFGWFCWQNVSVINCWSLALWSEWYISWFWFRKEVHSLWSSGYACVLANLLRVVASKMNCSMLFTEMTNNFFWCGVSLVILSLSVQPEWWHLPQLCNRLLITLILLITSCIVFKLLIWGSGLLFGLRASATQSGISFNQSQSNCNLAMKLCHAQDTTKILT